MIGLATRGSPLALWQAEQAKAALASALPGEQIEFVTVSTSGDDVQDRPVVLMGATGVFTVEVDRAVVEGRARCGVHSLKDLATQLEGGMVLAAVLPRGPVEDVIVSPKWGTLAALPQGAKVATGSLRRRAMLLRKRPDLLCVDIRGFVGTRLKKLERGDADALLMARAGLERLGMKDRITDVLPIDLFLPAVGQGLVGITCRADDREMLDAWRRAGDANGFAAATAERAFLATLRAGCHAPVGGHAVIRAGQLHLEGRVLSKDGVYEVAGSASAEPSEATALGCDLARRLIADGAADLLAG